MHDGKWILIAALLQSPALAQSAPAPPAPENQPARADLTEPRRLVREGKYPEAEQALAAIQQTYPDDPALLLLRGEVLLALGHADQAIPILRHSIEIDPQKARTHFQLGSGLATLGDRAGALEAFAKELEINQDAEVKVMAHLNRALLFQQDKRWSEAASDLEAVLALQPARKEAYGDLAAVYIEAGRVEDARGALERGVAAGLEAGKHFNALGAQLYRNQHFAEAEAAFRRALELEPGLADAERSLAAALDQLGKKQEANQHLRRYLELAPGAPDAAKVAERLKSEKAR